MSSAWCRGVELGDEFAVCGAGGSQILVAFLELQAQFDGGGGRGSCLEHRPHPLVDAVDGGGEAFTGAEQIVEIAGEVGQVGHVGAEVVAAGAAEPDWAGAAAGCDHFRTDVSYLPDLTGYLDDLLRTRERLAAAIDGVDEWARADATPSQQEITRIRWLIGRIDGDLGQASDTERAVIDEAVTVMRRHRAAFLGMPSTRATAPDVCPEATA